VREGGVEAIRIGLLGQEEAEQAGRPEHAGLPRR
jgi:hypothetical protein